MKVISLFCTIIFCLTGFTAIVTNNINSIYSPEGMMAVYYTLHDDVEGKIYNSGFIVYDRKGKEYLRDDTTIGKIYFIPLIFVKKRIIIVSNNYPSNSNSIIAYRVTKDGLKKINEIIEDKSLQFYSNKKGIAIYRYEDPDKYGLKVYDINLKKLINNIPIDDYRVYALSDAKRVMTYRNELNKNIITIYKKGKKVMEYIIDEISGKSFGYIIDKKNNIFYRYSDNGSICMSNAFATYMKKNGKKVFELQKYEDQPVLFTHLSYDDNKYLYIRDCVNNEVIGYKIGKAVEKVGIINDLTNGTVRVSSRGKKVYVFYEDNSTFEKYFRIYDKKLSKIFYTSAQYDNIYLLDDSTVVCETYFYNGGKIDMVYTDIIKNGKIIAQHQYKNPN